MINQKQTIKCAILTAAFVLCREEEARRVAGRYLRRWRHPLTDEDAERSAALLAGATNMLVGHGWDPADLVGAPLRHDGSAAYCPRCEAQFLDAGGECSDCRGVKVVDF